MPKGITQQEVSTAADMLVAAGEKPTVEKVRQTLGTGSPNTVLRMMETWRDQLAQRLGDVLKLPELPPPVGQAFTDVWRLATEHAQQLTHTALTTEQNQLAADRTSLDQEIKVWRGAVEAAQKEVGEAEAKLTQADIQMRERDVLLGQLMAQQADLLKQRDRLQTQLSQQQTEMEILRAERVNAQEHVRAAEDRAHRMVDEARQEAKSAKTRWERDEREAGKRIAQLLSQVEALRKTTLAAEQASARDAGRVAALETTLKQWRKKPSPQKAKPAAVSGTKPRAKKSRQSKHAQ